MLLVLVTVLGCLFPVLMAYWIILKQKTKKWECLQLGCIAIALCYGQYQIAYQAKSWFHWILGVFLMGLSALMIYGSQTVKPK